MNPRNLLLGANVPALADPLRELAASNTMAQVDPGPGRNWVGTGNKAEDPLTAYAALAQGGGQEMESVDDPLLRAMEYAKQKQAQLGQAPEMDASIFSDMDQGQRQRQMAEALMGQGYVQNSGALGALAQVMSAWKGQKVDQEAGETIADALQRQLRQESEAAQYADQVKAFDEGPKRIIQRTEEARALGLDGKAAQEYVLTGKLPRNAGPTTKERDFERAQRDPAYAAWLDKNAPKGTTVNVSNVGQSAFDRELGKQDAGTYATWRDNAVQAQKTLAQLENVEQILTAAETGKVNEALAMAGQYFGTEAGANLQTLKAAIQPIVLSQVKQLGSGNGITDADRKFIEAGMPGFGNDPRANERVVRIMEQSAGANIRLYEEADKHLAQVGSLRGFKPTVVAAPMGGGGGMQDTPDPLGIRGEL